MEPTITIFGTVETTYDEESKIVAIESYVDDEGEREVDPPITFELLLEHVALTDRANFKELDDGDDFELIIFVSAIGDLQ